MTWTLPQPMLTAPVVGPELPSGWAAEPKWDGSPVTLRCLIRVHLGGGENEGPAEKWRGVATV